MNARNDIPSGIFGMNHISSIQSRSNASPARKSSPGHFKTAQQRKSPSASRLTLDYENRIAKCENAIRDLHNQTSQVTIDAGR